MSTTPDVLSETLHNFRKYKALGEGAMSQVSDEELFRSIDEEANSIALIVKHMRGNMLSRWRDFLTTDGEKPDRDRDSEFVVAASTTRAELLARWEEGWRCLFQALTALHEEDLPLTVLIRAEPHSVIRAINRQLAHNAYHLGQIVLLAKHFASDHWQTLSVPRGGSAAFNAAKMGRPPSA